MQVAKKVTPQQFKLTTQAGRMGLLLGISAGTVLRKELEVVALQDAEKRPYRKPVVVEDIRFDSVTEAAEYLLKQHMRRYKVIDVARKLDCYQHMIARKCNQDCWAGYYWAE